VNRTRFCVLNIACSPKINIAPALERYKGGWDGPLSEETGMGANYWKTWEYDAASLIFSASMISPRFQEHARVNQTNK